MRHHILAAATVLLAATLTACNNAPADQADSETSDTASETMTSAVNASAEMPDFTPDPNTADAGLPFTSQEGEDAEARQKAIEKLSHMVGYWEGEATVSHPEGEITVTQHEVVRRHLSGDLMSIQGMGTDDAGDGVFSAFAILTYDNASESYLWRAYSDQSPTGEPIESELELTDDGWAWESPAGEDPEKMYLRHEATFDGDTWTEVSKMTRDGGETWNTTMEMSLTRQ